MAGTLSARTDGKKNRRCGGGSPGADECSRLRGAMDAALEMFGPDIRWALLAGLEKRGISLSAPCSGIAEIEQAVKELAGKQAAGVIMERLRGYLLKDSGPG